MPCAGIVLSGVGDGGVGFLFGLFTGESGMWSCWGSASFVHEEQKDAGVGHQWPSCLRTDFTPRSGWPGSLLPGHHPLTPEQAAENHDVDSVVRLHGPLDPWWWWW